jgi:hypothetical protein
VKAFWGFGEPILFITQKYSKDRVDYLNLTYQQGEEQLQLLGLGNA